MISGFWQKLGFYSDKLITRWKKEKDWIWFHAVSVGELKAVWPLVLEINKQKPSYPIMLSCTTKAGYKLAGELTKEKKFLTFYFPFDLPVVINLLLDLAKIKLLIIVETEIWPNLLHACQKRKIPVVLVNARLSDKSFKNYYLLRFYFKNVVNLFSEVLAQSENDANKFKMLGIDNNKISILGNLKFANLKQGSKDRLRAIENGVMSIIFASTHKGEEEIAISTLKRLQVDFPNIRLIIAPRHTNRVPEIIHLIKKNNFVPVLKTQSIEIKSSSEVLIINTIGELQKFFETAEITVLGGTFVKIGGHNILEPIRAKSYTIIGPYDFKIAELSSLFKSKSAIAQVNNPDELVSKIREALLDKSIRDISTRNGITIIEQNATVLEQTNKQILSYL